MKRGGNCGYAGSESSNLSSPPGESSEEQTQADIQHWLPSPISSSLSAMGSDPFDYLGITQCPESKMLFNHCKFRNRSTHIFFISVLIYWNCGNISQKISDINYRTLTRTPTRRSALEGEVSDPVRSDEALIHTAILLAANHWVLLGGNPASVSSAFYHHKIEAIRINNERLGHPIRAGLVGTVGAVAAMTLVEVRFNLKVFNPVRLKS